MYLQKVTKTSLSAFDEKQKCLNSIESIPLEGNHKNSSDERFKKKEKNLKNLEMLKYWQI